MNMALKFEFSQPSLIRQNGSTQEKEAANLEACSMSRGLSAIFVLLYILS